MQDPRAASQPGVANTQRSSAGQSDAVAHVAPSAGEAAVVGTPDGEEDEEHATSVETSASASAT